MAEHELMLAFALIALAATFLGIAIAIQVTIEKPKKWHRNLFYILAAFFVVSYCFLMWRSGAWSWFIPQNEQTFGTENSYLPYWLTAIGTILLAFVTFFIGVIKPGINKPCFSIDFKNEEPWCRKATLIKPKGVSSYWIRLRVSNSGKSVAKRCLGKLIKITDDTGSDVRDFDPAALLWVGVRPDEIPLSAIDINRKDFEYLNVLYTQQNDPTKAFICRDKLPRGTIVSLEPGIYFLTITIYSDNVEPKSQKYRLIWGASDFKDIRLELE